MFWGLNLRPNRKYSQRTERAFHISHVALDADSSPGGHVQFFVSSENQRYLVCTLRKGETEQVTLDLNFASGHEICFQSIGSGNVTLTGYIMEYTPSDFMSCGDGKEFLESDVEIEQNDLRNALNAKKANKNKAEKAKAAKKTVDEDEDEDDSDMQSDDDEEDAESEEEEDEDDDDEEIEDGEDEEDEDEEDDSDEDDSEDEEIQEPKAKQPKLEKQQNGVATQKEQAEKKSKKELKKEKQQQQKAQDKQQKPHDKQQKPQDKQKAGGERVLSGGVKIVDVRAGNGPEAKIGKRVQVYYEGRLPKNNKVFDSLTSGAGFKFNLGRGEVIKGWDIGVLGMKVGGKRRITCPPHMAYGSRGSPPAIPPNSTLVFEVELKGVN